MLKNIKLNKDYWHKKIPNLKYGVPNPLLVFSDDEAKFSEAMTSFRFASVFKTTGAFRHQQTQLFLKEYINTNENIILDIGASDGSTSLNFINQLNQRFKNYYVTDYNIECTYICKNGYTYFFNQANACFLIASKKFVFYPNNSWIVNLLFKKKLTSVKNEVKSNLLLCNRKLLQAQNENHAIVTMPYNIFEPWNKEKADVVIVGNLLNRAYFSDKQIIHGLSNCYDALSNKGLLAIIRNELVNNNEIEHANVYRKNIYTKSFERIHEINGGVEINELILSSQFS